MTIKKDFKIKVAAATDVQLSDGYPILKKKFEVANVTLQVDRETVAEMLQNQNYLDALDKVEQSKLLSSILQWKMNTIKDEIVKRVVEQDGIDGDF